MRVHPLLELQARDRGGQDDPEDAVERRLETSRPAPFAVELTTVPGVERSELDPGQAPGVKLRLIG
jgi:hypothetical protein